MKDRIERRAASPSRAKRCGARGVAACSPGAFARASGSRHDNEGAGEQRANPAPADREGHSREGRRL
jgi:hypothetical protein